MPNPRHPPRPPRTTTPSPSRHRPRSNNRSARQTPAEPPSSTSPTRHDTVRHRKPSPRSWIQHPRSRSRTRTGRGPAVAERAGLTPCPPTDREPPSRTASDVGDPNRGYRQESGLIAASPEGDSGPPSMIVTWSGSAGGEEDQVTITSFPGRSEIDPRIRTHTSADVGSLITSSSGRPSARAAPDARRRPGPSRHARRGGRCVNGAGCRPGSGSSGARRPPEPVNRVRGRSTWVGRPSRCRDGNVNGRTT
jgi:hypothetical protein